MSGNADEFRQALEEGNYDPDEGIVNDSDSRTDSSSDFGEELGSGQRTSGGDSPDTEQTDSGGTQSDSDGSQNGRLSDSPLDVSSGDSGTTESGTDDSQADADTEFPSPEEVNETVADADTAQQDTDLANTGSGDVQDNFDSSTGGSSGGLGGDPAGDTDREVSETPTETTQTAEEATDTGTPDIPDRRLVEVSETGTAGDVQFTRDATQRTINNEQISSIDLGENNAVRVPREPTTETLLAGTDTTSPTQSGTTPAPTTEQQTTEDIPLSEDQRDSIESSLEEQTNADLSRDDYQVTVDEDGQLVARLSDEGQETVEVQNTPGRNIPVVGGILTTGTRARAAYRDVTQPAADAFYNTVPTGSDVLGLVGAAAPAAAAEPTPVGEIGLGGVLAGAAAVGIGSQVGGQVAGEDPTAQTDIAIPERDNRRQGEIQPGETNPDELEPGETQTTELEVPEERTTVSPEELGVPRDAVQDGNAEISGPEGTEITDEGDIVIPAGTTQATGKQKRFEDEEEEEEADEDEEEEEAEEEEDEVVVEVPEEFIPDEGATIGGEGATEPVEETETRTEESESEAEEESEEPLDDIFNPRQGTQEDDAQPDDTQADEDFAEDQPTSGDATQPATPELDEGTDSTFPGAIGGGGSGATLPPILDDEQQTGETGAGGGAEPTVPGVIEDEDQQQGQPDAEAPVEQPGQVPGQVPGQIQPPAQDTPQIQLPGQAQTPLQGEADTVAEPVQTGAGTGTGVQLLRAQVRVREQTQVQQQQNRRRRRPRFPEFESDPSGDDEEFEQPGVADPELTDFLDPVTGERLETTLTPASEGFSLPFGRE